MFLQDDYLVVLKTLVRRANLDEGKNMPIRVCAVFTEVFICVLTCLSEQGQLPMPLVMSYAYFFPVFQQEIKWGLYRVRECKC